jgi:hypothetical protein
MGREGFTKDEKKKMMLSLETLEGLRITGNKRYDCYYSYIHVM